LYGRDGDGVALTWWNGVIEVATSAATRARRAAGAVLTWWNGTVETRGSSGGQGSVADWPCCFFLSVSSSKEDNLRLKTVVASARRLLKIEISFFSMNAHGSLQWTQLQKLSE